MKGNIYQKKEYWQHNLGKCAPWRKSVVSLKCCRWLSEIIHKFTKIRRFTWENTFYFVSETGFLQSFYCVYWLYLSDRGSRMIKFSIFPRVYCLFPIPFLSTSSSRFPPHRQTVSAGSSDSRGEWRQLTDHTISNLSPALVRSVASSLFISNVLCALCHT